MTLSNVLIQAFVVNGNKSENPLFSRFNTKGFTAYSLGNYAQRGVFVQTSNNLSLWEATVGSSYMCNKEQNFTITSLLSLYTFNLHVQPFGVKNGLYSTGLDFDWSVLVYGREAKMFSTDIKSATRKFAIVFYFRLKVFIFFKLHCAEECFLDADLSFLVPIAVGVALSFLIILVLISYLIGRRKSRTGYQSV
ncbi:hypothetical protein GOODEAATRI_002173 [Goodea atripinnis]|uniref:Uncharacterized protein n=1 Tax=Goodea atripinnis TaxID=208336 RepID=A0ABV0MY00_9TELE